MLRIEDVMEVSILQGMQKAQFLPPSHYESHEFQFQLVAEVIPTELEGSAWEVVIEEQVELVVLDVLPWVLPKLFAVGKHLVLLVSVAIE